MIKFISPKKAVNSAFLKLPVSVENMEQFKLSLVNLYKKCDLTKDERGKRAKGTLLNLDYIFKFLDAYNFASDAQGGVVSTSKTLVNASVLGLIFEKINGYKDGSFFTPGFITDYMAREVLERSVVQKFNEAKGWNCKNLNDV